MCMMYSVDVRDSVCTKGNKPGNAKILSKIPLPQRTPFKTRLPKIHVLSWNLAVQVCFTFPLSLLMMCVLKHRKVNFPLYPPHWMTYVIQFTTTLNDNCFMSAVPSLTDIKHLGSLEGTQQTNDVLALALLIFSRIAIILPSPSTFVNQW